MTGGLATVIPGSKSSMDFPALGKNSGQTFTEAPAFIKPFNNMVGDFSGGKKFPARIDIAL